MASVSYHIANLLEKMTSSDKDFRFMATNDLMGELQKDSIKLDDDSERKVVKMLLKLLEDKNGEVQNLAVKCLGPLVNKVKEFQVETIVDTLCSNMLSDKEQLRDISSIGLKTVISELPPSSTTLAANICKKITGRLTSAIAKQEDVSVQLEALDILGDLLSRFGGLLVSFHSSILQALLPQLSSPRLAVRKRTIIAIGHLVMSCNNTLFLELIEFLLSELSKNTSTSTTRTYIQCIGAISRQAGHRFGEHLEKIIPLIVRYCREDDDELREYCLQAFESFVRRCPKEVSPFITEIIGICLQYLCHDPNYNYDDDEDSDEMMDTEADAIHKQAFHSIAKCVAALTTINPEKAGNVVNQFVCDIKNPKSTDSIVLFSLLALGEIGKHIDLSSHGEIQSVILESFSSPNEEVKSAASYALGNVSVGNMQKFLPFVLQEIENQPKRQYLLLHSLKEIISCESSSTTGVESLKPFVQTIWSMLFNHCECPEEGTRNVVSECLGKLTLIDPDNQLRSLQSHLDSESALTRSTVVTAIKFTISDQPQAIDMLLRGCIGDFLKTLQDPDLNVRRVALVTFNSAAHNKPSLIRDLLDSVLPHLYNETKMRKELIREVEMGPFKHTLDDGLDIRKAAFECMYTLLDSCLDRLDIFEFLNHVEDGLKDHYDIKMLTYLMLVRLSHLCPSAVLQRLDRLVDPLRATCTTKVKAHSVKQEFEKQDELKRSALRAVAALLNIPDADKSPQMNDFLTQVKSSAELASMFETIQKDAMSTPLDSMSMDTS
ncbi:cullin-associated NEDD8-dissociated protein 1 [Patella vulgata]|uniref:cullin-associated NEDD8-dissociated protein 1 n=1 Tax=Patella vulgata TaxID=6465 RepID=UPI002180257B|nr:cullin-associated NEDD8-dissociated protein 1 [Patella vulgata]